MKRVDAIHIDANLSDSRHSSPKRNGPHKAARSNAPAADSIAQRPCTQADTLLARFAASQASMAWRVLQV
jgi:hypothetical protein